MRTYKLIMLEKNKQLGTVDITDNFNRIVFKLSLLMSKDDQNALKRLIQNVLNNYPFKEADIKPDIKNLIIINGSKILWKALVQSMMINMKIVASEK